MPSKGSGEFELIAPHALCHDPPLELARWHEAAFELVANLTTIAAIASAMGGGGKLRIPVLSIGGEAGDIGGAMHPMCEEIADNTIHKTAPGAGHWIPEENPSFVCETIREFLSRRPHSRQGRVESRRLRAIPCWIE